MPDYKDFSIKLVRRALNSNDELPRNFRSNASGTWLGNAIFQIAAIHDHDEPILYIGATMTHPRKGDDAQEQLNNGYLGGVVIAFSETVFYRAVATERDLTTTAYPLALRSLAVTQVQGSYDGAFNSAPYMVEVEAELSNGGAFHLPVTPGATEPAFDELQAALSALRKALTPASYEERWPEPTE
ncbi:hypothetical protein E7Z53_11580 [Kocuria salina]|uniref:hypothetical protein n=1 Tax=Kocuria salina TaxID=1929416 RepID=UPI0015937A5C|nr:hypothetical protein [Kocuria salina]NVC24073.1 hypothetical protein [Kocuria salina]